MTISPNAWNQVVNPEAESHGAACDNVWLQFGYQDQSDRVMGREDIAQAIATAEEMIAQALGFWPAPKWTVNERKTWPRPRRGCQWRSPPMETGWGYVLGGGTENTATIIDQSAAIVYSDADGDTVLDTATITIAAADMTAADATVDDVAVYYSDSYIGLPVYPVSERWRIKPLRIRTNSITGDVVITGRRAQFVDPQEWLENDDVQLDNDPSFIDSVDVRKRFNLPTLSAQFVWKPEEACLCSCVPACSETCQAACLIVDDERTGTIRLLPATYTVGTKTWAYNAHTVCHYPSQAALNYYAGWYRDIPGWMEADWMQPMLAEAIVRLANVYMPDIPCGCDLVKRKWERDREEQDINTVDAHLTMSAFGSVTRGSLFAWGAVKRLKPLSGAGSL
jgi:hypothetical protein